MIKSTPRKHQDTTRKKSKDSSQLLPSSETISFILSYAAALRIYNTKGLGNINILLN